jgi:hypothetical protein
MSLWVVEDEKEEWQSTSEIEIEHTIFRFYPIFMPLALVVQSSVVASPLQGGQWSGHGHAKSTTAGMPVV